MANKRIYTEHLHSFLRKVKIATLPQIKKALRTQGTMTVFRKLKALEYLSSYSHKGKYYTLKSIPDFDSQGLWEVHSIWFSKYGNLIETSFEFVSQSEAGFTAQELVMILHVECKRALLMLYRQDRLTRKRFKGANVYFSADKSKQRTQIQVRQQSEGTWASHIPEEDVLAHEIKAAIILFFSLLDERQRRLYAGLQAQIAGRGGDRKVANLLGLDVHTVARGRRELFEEEINPTRIRKAGGGRKAVEKKHQK
jgi:hypothetical protein